MKRWSKALLPVLALGLAVAGCGGSGNGNGGADAGGAANEAADAGGAAEPAKKVELTLWSFEARDPHKTINQKAIEKFNAEHPNIKLKAEFFDDESFKQKIKVAMAGNRMPDLFTYWSGDQLRTLVDGGVAGDLTEQLSADAAFKDSILPGGLESFSYDGKNYAVPLAMNAVMIYYNKEIFEKNGLQPPATWSDLETAVQKLNEAKVIPIAVAGKDRWPVLHWFSYLAQRIGGDEPFQAAAAGTSDFTDPSFIEAGQKLSKLAAADKGFVNGFLGLDYGAAEALFTQGKAAMYMQGDWAVAGFVKDDAFAAKVGFVPFPTAEGGKSDQTTFQGGFGFGYAMSSKADKAAAYEAIKFLSSPQTRSEISEQAGTIQPFKDVQLDQASMKPLAYEVMSFISANAKGFFPYYDQGLDPKRSEAMLNAVVSIASKPDADVKAELEKVKK
ncbi:extracellular solute-binding protein [Paenibacillus albicereus]|uniref:Extracellular solute-binding protein n=1 Tax=Paenibacillus albicereus TaxID=2726185 RepID=A0A6H2GU74_9BACL|nr:extracellular solute-binding protein [Paenibacillus albicereus]QJC50984.1 extracellular solute-binding protein [Paenibacillus albicereus]